MQELIKGVNKMKSNDWLELLRGYVIEPSVEGGPIDIRCDRLEAVLFKSFVHESFGTPLEKILKDPRNVECDFTNYERKPLILLPDNSYTVTWVNAGGEVENDIHQMMLFLEGRKVISINVQAYTDGSNITVNIGEVKMA